MNCPQCDAELPSSALFCSRCGHALELESQRRDDNAGRRKPYNAGRLTPHATIATSDLNDDEEHELWRGRYSAKGMINYWLVAIGATVILPVIGLYAHLDRVGWIGLSALMVVLWIGLACVLVAQKLDVHYVLTNQRLIHKSGILTRQSHRIEVIDFDDVSYRQGIFERLVGVGTIEVVSSDRSDPVLELTGIDHVHHVASMMDEARRAERIRRGLHIEAV